MQHSASHNNNDTATDSNKLQQLILLEQQLQQRELACIEAFNELEADAIELDNDREMFEQHKHDLLNYVALLENKLKELGYNCQQLAKYKPTYAINNSPIHNDQTVANCQFCNNECTNKENSPPNNIYYNTKPTVCNNNNKYCNYNNSVLTTQSVKYCSNHNDETSINHRCPNNNSLDNHNNALTYCCNNTRQPEISTNTYSNNSHKHTISDILKRKAKTHVLEEYEQRLKQLANQQRK